MKLCCKSKHIENYKWMNVQHKIGISKMSVRISQKAQLKRLENLYLLLSSYIEAALARSNHNIEIFYISDI